MKNRMRPIHPGEILREEFLVPLDMSARQLARALDVPANRVSSIVAGKRDISADTALRLAKALGTGPEVWLNLQQTYDLRKAELDKKAKRSRVKVILRSGASDKAHAA
jgi:addiction module HigA family antidote